VKRRETAELNDPREIGGEGSEKVDGKRNLMKLNVAGKSTSQGSTSGRRF